MLSLFVSHGMAPILQDRNFTVFTAFLNEFATVVESFVQYTVKIIMKINVFCCWIQVEPCTLKNFHIS